MLRVYSIIAGVIISAVVLFGTAYNPAVIECPTCATTRIDSLNIPGDYVFELRVQDDSGAWSAGDLVTVHVLPGVPLPVKYLYFRGSALQNENLIEWATAQEFNTDYFQVEAGTDGVHFHYIAYQNAVGNSTSITKYILHHATTDPITYYRLKQVDIDGRFSYSDILFVSRQIKADIKLAGISRNEIKILVTSPIKSQLDLYLYDAVGRLITKKRTSVISGNNIVALNFNPTYGVYFLKCDFSNTSKTIKFLFQ